MENIYFPIFLVVLAVFVIWLFNRSKGGRIKREDRRYKSSSGRMLNNENLQRSVDRKGPAAGYVSKHSPRASDAMWRKRKQRARHEHSRANSPGADHNVFQADYLGPGRKSGSGRDAGLLQEQVSHDTEHLGIDEYLTKTAKARKAQAAQEDKEFSMTAMKYDPADSSSEEAEGGKKKQAGFKP
jgi:hypothetical protein